jgi:hypothetical protein
MKAGRKPGPEALTARLIAPCGLNCALCSGFQRRDKPCGGCNSSSEDLPNFCASCRIKNCEHLPQSEQSFCFSCSRFPCARLRQLEKRYRTKYGESLMENQACIRDQGMDFFLELEKSRWLCSSCGKLVCVHRAACMVCGSPRQAQVSTI